MWLQHALKKKKLLLFVLCLEFPLILTGAEHVVQLHDALVSSNSQNLHDDEAKGTWPLCDHKALHQHWVACPRQLEQLLQLLFKWKAKRSDRDVLLPSGGMRIGLDTLLHDRESKLALRNLTCGPITANVEPFEFALAESPDAREEHARRQHALETRIRKLNDRKQQQLVEKQHRQQEKLKQQSAAE